MAAVVKPKGKSRNVSQMVDGEKHEENKIASLDSQLTTPLLSKQDEKPYSVVVDIDKASRPTSGNKQDVATNGPHTSEDIEDGEVIGIITLEDVFEELLQVHCCPRDMSSFKFFIFMFYISCLNVEFHYQCRRRLWMKLMNMLTSIKGNVAGTFPSDLKNN